MMLRTKIISNFYFLHQFNLFMIHEQMDEKHFIYNTRYILHLENLDKSRSYLFIRFAIILF